MKGELDLKQNNNIFGLKDSSHRLVMVMRLKKPFALEYLAADSTQADQIKKREWKDDK